MKLEEIKEEIVKASSMGNTELVRNFQQKSQFANMIFNSIVDTKDERKASTIDMMIEATIKSYIYENEIKDRLTKGGEWREYSSRLEYKNDDLNTEIGKLKQKIADMQKTTIEKENE